MNSSIDDDNELAKHVVPRRFFFDNLDLDENAIQKAKEDEAAAKAAEEQRKAAEAAAKLETEKKLAHEAGVAEGRRMALEEARNSIETLTAKTLQQIERHLRTLLQAERKRHLDMQDQTIRLVLSIIRKVMPGLAAESGLIEVENVIQQILTQHMDEQRLVVRVSTQLVPQLKDRIDVLGENMGYTGKLILVGEDMIGPTDCRIEWADGGAERNMDDLLERVDTTLRQALATLPEQEEMEDVRRDAQPPHEAETKTNKKSTDVANSPSNPSSPPEKLQAKHNNPSTQIDTKADDESIKTNDQTEIDDQNRKNKQTQPTKSQNTPPLESGDKE